MENLLVRTWPAELVADTDGRSLHGRCVPFGVPADVVAVGPDGPKGTVYQEAFARGAFHRAVKAPQRVLLRFEHRDGLLDVAGYGEALEERDDGLYGTFRTLDSSAGEQALALHRAGVLGYFSVGFAPIGKGRRQNGTVIRTHVHLDEVSLCREAAYPGTEAIARSAGLVPFKRPEPWAIEDRLQAVLSSGAR